MENFVFFKRLTSSIFPANPIRLRINPVTFVRPTWAWRIMVESGTCAFKTGSRLLAADNGMSWFDIHAKRASLKRLTASTNSSSIFPRRSLDRLPSLGFSDLWYYIRGFGFLDDVSKAFCGPSKIYNTPYNSFCFCCLDQLSNNRQILDWWAILPLFSAYNGEHACHFSFCPTWLYKYLLETQVKVL